MRATSHNGRWGSVKHNGRGFDLTKAGHIDQSRVRDNLYWHWDQEDGDNNFEGAEERYYHKQFGVALAAQNKRHMAARQRNRVKTMSDWLNAKNTCPEETIWQIGNMTEDVDPEDFAAAVEELQEWLTEWSAAHGEPYKILDTAIHMDEASPHAHSRRVWQYQDVDGTWKIGQNKALAAAGVPLPNPSAPEGPKNNRKMTFDAMVRDKWMEICESYGYEIERKPDPTHETHLPKEQYIYLHEREAELDERAAQLRMRETDVRVSEKQTVRRSAELDHREQDIKAREQALDSQANDQANLIADGRKYRAMMAAQARRDSADRLNVNRHTTQSTRELPHIGLDL